MTRFLDDGLIIQAREARERLLQGASQATEAVEHVENLLRELGLAVRVWLPVGKRTVHGEGGSRVLEIFLGYTDEGDGVWGVKLKASDPRRARGGRFLRLHSCSQAIQIRLLPKLRELVTGVVGRARELADLMEKAVSDGDA